MSQISRNFLVFSFFVLPLAVSANDDVFARQGDVVVTHAELDAAFARIPLIYRMNFIRNGEKVDQLVRSLINNKLIGAAAAQDGFDQDPIVVNRMKLTAEKELADAWLDHVVEKAPQADYEALAQENYLANPENFQTPEMVDVSHILISSETRPEEDALEEATRLRNELMQDPGLFDEYVMTYSEDPARVNNNGRYSQMTRGQMVQPFEEMAFSMTVPGSISELVETSYGFHILRLNAQIPPATIPFEQVKAQLVEEARNEYLSKYKKRYIDTTTAGAIVVDPEDIEAMAKRHFGENLELAPGYYD
jgi:peptidyl-prolyl cis-trans isomerase C